MMRQSTFHNATCNLSGGDRSGINQGFLLKMEKSENFVKNIQISGKMMRCKKCLFLF